QMKTWDARWRPESLDHYLQLGWSFGVLEDNQLKAYVLAQPFLFFRSFTQTLWVEWIAAVSSNHAARAIEVAYRWTRDKHFQTLVLESNQEFSHWATGSSFPFEDKDGFLVLKTSKIK